MIVGIGCDILDIPRMKRELGDAGLAEQIFTSKELAYCRGKRYPERHIAARFAAKEAFFKAITSGRRVDIPWHDVEITNEKSGKPIMKLTGKARKLARARKARKVHVTMSHSAKYATAYVVLES